MKKILFYSILSLLIISCQSSSSSNKLTSVIYIDDGTFESFGISTQDAIYNYENEEWSKIVGFPFGKYPV